MSIALKSTDKLRQVLCELHAVENEERVYWLGMKVAETSYEIVEYYDMTGAQAAGQAQPGVFVDGTKVKEVVEKICRGNQTLSTLHNHPNSARSTHAGRYRVAPCELSQSDRQTFEQLHINYNCSIHFVLEQRKNINEADDVDLFERNGIGTGNRVIAFSRGKNSCELVAYIKSNDEWKMTDLAFATKQ